LIIIIVFNHMYYDYCSLVFYYQLYNPSLQCIIPQAVNTV